MNKTSKLEIKNVNIVYDFDVYAQTIKDLDRAKELGIIEDYLVFIANNDLKEKDLWRTRISLVDTKETTDYALLEIYWLVQGMLLMYEYSEDVKFAVNLEKTGFFK